MSTNRYSKRDVYQDLTAAVCADLEKGVLPWNKPWNTGGMALVSRPLRWNGTPYTGINVLMLWMQAMKMGFANPIWMTYRQAIALGGHVRKGETGSTVVYASAVTRTKVSDLGETDEERIPFLKSYTVFCVEQMEDLPAQYYATMSVAPRHSDERNEVAEAFFAATGAQIVHNSKDPVYRSGSGLDQIGMPPFETFDCADSYYAALAHELTHWTRHERRLDRSFSQKRFGDEGYAMEELVAELGAAFLCADLGIKPRLRDDHVPYISHWLQALKNDKRAIFTAAGHAERAISYLHGLQPSSTEGTAGPAADDGDQDVDQVKERAAA